MRYLALQLKFTTPPVTAYCHGHKVETLDLVFCFGDQHKPQSLGFYKEAFSTDTLDNQTARAWLSEGPISLLLERTSPLTPVLEKLLGTSLDEAARPSSSFQLQPGDEVLRICVEGQSDSAEMTDACMAEILCAAPSTARWLLHSLKRS